MINLGTMLVMVGADIKGLKAGMARAEGVVHKSSGRMAMSAPMIGAAFGIALLAIGASASKMSMQVNKSMANVGTLIPRQTERLIELKKEVLSLSVDTGQALDSITGGLYQVISAFMDTADTVKILDINTRAAAAGLSTVNDAVNLTSAVTKGYGDTTAEAVQHAADLAFETVRLGQVTFPQLAQSMGRTVPTMAAVGGEIEELFALYSTLTGVTGDASIVTTQLRGILNAFLKPSAAMKDSLDELGYSTTKEAVEALGLVGALQAVIETTDGTAESVAALFQNRRALPAVFVLAGNQADTFTFKLSEMNDALGATDLAYEQVAEGINVTGHELAKFGQRFKANMIDFGDDLNKYLLGPILKLDRALSGLPRIEDLWRQPEEDTQTKKLGEQLDALKDKYTKLTGETWKWSREGEEAFGNLGSAVESYETQMTESFAAVEKAMDNVAIKRKTLGYNVKGMLLFAVQRTNPYEKLEFGAKAFGESIEGFAEELKKADEILKGSFFYVAPPPTEIEAITAAIEELEAATKKAVEEANRMASVIFTPPEILDPILPKLPEYEGEWVPSSWEKTLTPTLDKMTAINEQIQKVPDMIMVGTGALEEFRKEAELASIATDFMVHGIFEFARYGKDAFAMLADAFSRLAESMIADFLRVKAYAWFIPALEMTRAPAGVGQTFGWPAPDLGGTASPQPMGFAPAPPPGMTVNVHNYASEGTEIETRQTPGMGGKQIEIFITDTVKTSMRLGKFNKEMGGIWGLNRKGRRR